MLLGAKSRCIQFLVIEAATGSCTNSIHYLSVVIYLFIQLFKTEMIANGQKIKIGDWFDGVI